MRGKMDKTPVMYITEQMEQMQKWITEHYGESDSYLVHEIVSEYVHTDVQIAVLPDRARNFVTFGMGARKMNAPEEALERVELVMSASPALELQSERGMSLLGELTAMSKFPFRKDTWLGPGHTLPLSDRFRDTFGYDCALLVPDEEVVHIPETGPVCFLRVIPIYRDEREWIMENGSFLYADYLYGKIGEKMFWMDQPREHFIPDEDEAMDVALMRVLGINRSKLEKLQIFLTDAEISGEEMSYERILQWLEDNKD